MSALYDERGVFACEEGGAFKLREVRKELADINIGAAAEYETCFVLLDSDGKNTD